MFSGFPVAQYLGLSVVFRRSLVVFFSFFFANCILCPSIMASDNTFDVFEVFW
jgi:hypothetical protein